MKICNILPQNGGLNGQSLCNLQTVGFPPGFIAVKGKSPNCADKSNSMEFQHPRACPPAQGALQSDGVIGASHEHVGIRGRIDHPKVSI